MILKDVSKLTLDDISNLLFIKQNLFVLDIIDRLKKELLTDSFFTMTASQLDKNIAMFKPEPFFDKYNVVLIYKVSMSDVKKIVKLNRNLPLKVIMIMEDGKSISTLKRDKKLYENPDLQIVYSNYLGNDYYKNYMYEYLGGEITPKALNALYNRLSPEINRCGWYLQKLKKLILEGTDIPLTPTFINKNVPDLRLFRIEKYLQSLLTGKKQLPIKTLSGILEHTTPEVILRVLIRHTEALLKLSQLKLKGKLSQQDYWKDISKLKKDNDDLSRVIRNLPGLQESIDIVWSVSSVQLTLIYSYLKTLSVRQNIEEYDLYEFTVLVQNKEWDYLLDELTKGVNKFELQGDRVYR